MEQVQGWMVVCVGVPLTIAILWAISARIEDERHRERMREIELSGQLREARRKADKEADEEDAKRQAVLSEYGQKLQAIWKRYDDEPKAKQNKVRLGEAADEVAKLVEGTPDEFRQVIGNAGMAGFRKRTAPLIRPETYADGPEYKTLIPAKDLAKCLMWGSMWFNNNAADMRKMGFTKIACPDQKREWEL